MGMYDLIKQLYEEFNQGNLNKAREIMGALIKNGMDKKFLAEAFKTIATEKMAQALYDEVAGSLKRNQKQCPKCGLALDLCVCGEGKKEKQRLKK